MKNSKKMTSLLLMALMSLSGCNISVVVSTPSNNSNSSTFNPMSSSVIKDSSTGSKDSSTGSKDSSTGSKDSSTGAKDSSTGSKDSSTGSKDSSTGVKDSSSSNSSSSKESSSSSTTPTPDLPQRYVYSINKKQSFVRHNNNKAEQENKKNEFVDRTLNYRVGDDNALSFMPILTTIIPNYDDPLESETFVENEWNFNVKLEKLVEGSYTLVNVNDYLDSLNNAKCLLDFNNNAINNTFKVTLVPTGLTSNQDPAKFTVDYVVDVVDGYNVTNAKELAYIARADRKMIDQETHDNINFNTAAIWNAYKEENGLQLNFHPSTMILHDNITLDKSNFPKEYFYTESEVNASDADYGNWSYTVDENNNRFIDRRVIGSLKDYVSLFPREMSAGETFKLEGNFFKLETSTLPTVVREDNDITPVGKGNSHADLFKFYGLNGEANVSMSNLKLDGNAPKANDSALSGGLIFLKTEGEIQYKAYNNVSIRWFITYFPAWSKSVTTIEKCKLYDNFTSFFYFFGATGIIKDTEAIGAGGPAIIQDHVGLDTVTDTSDDLISHTTITNSKIESKVTGTEGWFTIYGASALVPQIKALDALFTPFGRTFLSTGQSNEKYFNLIAINKSSEAESVTANTNVKGTINFDGYSFDYGVSNPYLGALYQYVTSLPAVPPVFETNAGGFGYTDGATGIYDHTNTQIVDPANNMYKGDKLCLYFNGMAVAFDYFAA